jgi:arginyl-tRNA synthetase
MAMVEVTSLETRLGEELARVDPGGGYAIDPCHLSGRVGLPGDFRVRNLDRLARQGREHCQTLARRLADSPVVGAAVAVPPNVYVRVDEEALFRCVTEAVLEQGDAYLNATWGQGGHVLISFSNPNFNKPLHLGHLRNNALGAALAALVQSRGFQVTRAATASDWGRHICQAVVAYRRWGNGETPEGTGEKSDHFVGRYYRLFHERADADASLADEASTLLLAVDAGSPAEMAVHRRLVGWAEGGVFQTHQRLGSHFDTIFLESVTRDLGPKLVTQAAADGTFGQRRDGSVFIDLDQRGLGQVTLLRRDGTSVVYTQLLGLYVARQAAVSWDWFIAVNGRQWADGHEILDAVLEALGYDWAKRQEAVLHGMVRCESRALRSREGGALNVDDLLDNVSARMSQFVGTRDGEALGTGLVKWFFLRTRPVKDIDFDEGVLWRDAYREFRMVIDGVARAERLAARSVASSIAPPAFRSAARSALLLLDAAPRVIDSAAVQRSPDEVLRYLRKLFAATEDIDGPNSEACETVFWSCLAQVARQCLAVVNIDLPFPLPTLPLLDLEAQPRPKRCISTA